MKNRSEEEPKKDSDNWRFGLFYFNPKDKRLFVIKKYGKTGLTLNFANPNSILIVAIIIALILLAIRFSY